MSINQPIIIKLNPTYMIYLLPRFFFKYGFIISVILFALFAVTLIHSGLIKQVNFLIGYALILLCIAFLRSVYEIKFFEFIFTKNDFTIPTNLFFKATIPYEAVANLSMSCKGFNVYQVNFTVLRTSRDLSFPINEYQRRSSLYSMGGFSKENAEKIIFLIQNDLGGLGLKTINFADI